MSRRVYHLRSNVDPDSTLCTRHITQRYYMITVEGASTLADPTTLCSRCRSKAERRGWLNRLPVAPVAPVDFDVLIDDTQHDEWLSRLGIC